MIVGLATLISILFFGGVSETFLVDKLEKGVKKYVVEKERQKEITADLKTSAKFIKAYNKNRKNQLKSFKDMNLDRNTSKEELSAFFNELIKDRQKFQERVLSSRIEIAKKIEPEEWKLILDLSDQSIDKATEKQQKKLEKGKTSKPFEKTFAAIDKYLTDKGRQEKVITALENYINSQKLAIDQLKSMNSQDNKVLKSKDSTKEELMKVAERLNELRKQGFDDLIDFHLSAKEFTTKTEWDQVMKTFNKEMSITAH